MITLFCSGKKTGKRQQKQQTLVLKLTSTPTRINLAKSFIMNTSLAKSLSSINIRNNSEEKPCSSKRIKSKIINDKKMLHNSRKKTKQQKWKKFPFDDMRTISIPVEVPTKNKSAVIQQSNRSYSDVVGKTLYNNNDNENNINQTTKKLFSSIQEQQTNNKLNLESNSYAAIEESNQMLIPQDMSQVQEPEKLELTEQSDALKMEAETSDVGMALGNEIENMEISFHGSTLTQDYVSNRSKSKEKSICNDVSYQMDYLSRNIKKLKLQQYNPLKSEMKLDMPLWNFIGVDEGPEVYPRFSHHFTDERYLLAEDLAKLALKLAKGNS